MCENYLNFDQKKSSPGRIIWNLLRENDFSSCQIMWTNLSNKIEYFEYLWSGMMQGEKINSRIQIGDKSKNEKRIHPSQKPIIVYNYLLHKYATPEMKILDTHSGSASLAIAAFYFGCDFVGTELDKDIFDASIKRYRLQTKQIRLL